VSGILECNDRVIALTTSNNVVVALHINRKVEI